jgi:hypothetical protein
MHIGYMINVILGSFQAIFYERTHGVKRELPSLTLEEEV